MSLKAATATFCCASFLLLSATSSGQQIHSLSKQATLFFAEDDDEGGGSLCGGALRWPVKMAEDPRAGEIDASNPEEKTPRELNAMVPTDDIRGNTARIADETHVYVVHGYLGYFKTETDDDRHLAIVDDTGNYSAGGTGTTPTGHSFVAEIPNIKCRTGSNGESPAQGRFDSEIDAARKLFDENTASMDGTNIPVGSVPVTVTGVLFFDRNERQVGRTKLHQTPSGKDVVTELHPILDIKFDAQH